MSPAAWSCGFCNDDKLYSHSKKIENIGKMTALTQEEVATHTRTVVQGLEALRNEHNSILSGISSTHSSSHHPPDSNVIAEKAGILQRSLDQIELGLSEAQVGIHFIY